MRVTALRARFLVSSLLVLAGCGSAVPPGLFMNESELVAGLRGRGLDPAQVARPMALTPAMRAWARQAIDGVPAGESQVRALLARILDPEALRLEYAWGYTGTAIDVFETREANCLAFTNLFVGMARELGLPVYFLLVHAGETFRKEGDLVVISDHVAVGYGPANQRLVIDLSADRQADRHRVEPISDLTALALYHSNRGAELLQSGDVERALRWLSIAVALDPLQASGWVNYGVALRRTGDVAGAETSYRRALEIAPELPSASTNLAALLRLHGRETEAREIELLLAEGLGGRNPYTYLALGDISLRHGRFEEANRLYRRAVTLKRDDAESWAALGELALAQSNPTAARRHLRRARKLDAEHPRVELLAQRLSDG